jgi:branched-chain amino acid aminotransferase
MEKAEKIWMDGRLVDWRDATVHFVSNTLHYGFGVFEGIRSYATAEGPAIFRLIEHLDRLRMSAKILGFDLPFSRDELVAATRDVVKANDFRECYIRPVGYIGYGGMGLTYDECDINLSIAAWEIGEYVGEGVLERGSRVKTSSHARHHINTNMIKAKASGNYMLFQMARAEARRNGCDEALLLDTNGHVAEGAVEHIFLVRDGTLVTPPLTHLLDGITRKTVLALARAEGYEVREELFSRDYVIAADEAFFTGTSAEVTPIVEVDGRKIGSGVPGPITKRLQASYFDAVHGRNPAHREWLTLV